MTVPVQTPFVKYTGNGATTVFTYPFKVLDIADIAVTVNGVVTAFTASGIGDNTGQVTISPAPVNASIVKISRNMVYQRTTDYQNNGALLENVLDADLDNVVLMLQQLKYFADRAFAFGEIMPGINMELPLPAAGKALIWNPAGAALINSTANPDTLAGSEAAAVAAAATASAASATATAAALIIAGFEYKLNWATATVYAKNNLFSDSGNTYIVLIAHTSAALLTTDITANRVKLFAQKGNAGVGTGDLLAANNLSEVNAGVARTNLGLAIGTNVQAFDANTAKTNAAQTYTAAQRGAVAVLTDAANVAINLALSNNYSLTIAGNRTLANPTNAVAGQTGIIAITQDGTGNRTLTYDTQYKFENGIAPVLSTIGGAIDYLRYFVVSATNITLSVPKKITSTATLATTSGTSHSYSGIPDGAKKITIMLAGVSTNGTTNLRIRIGPAAGLENSGYLGSSSVNVNAAGTQVISFTAGFDINDAAASAASNRHGALTLYLLDSATNTWVIEGGIGQSDIARLVIIQGSKALGGVLNQIALTTVNGIDVFDGGIISLIIE